MRSIRYAKQATTWRMGQCFLVHQTTHVGQSALVTFMSAEQSHAIPWDRQSSLYRILIVATVCSPYVGL